jgi:hypothetical protein
MEGTWGSGQGGQALAMFLQKFRCDHFGCLSALVLWRFVDL